MNHEERTSTPKVEVVQGAETKPGGVGIVKSELPPHGQKILHELTAMSERLQYLNALNLILEVRNRAVAWEVYAQQKKMSNEVIKGAHKLCVDSLTRLGGYLEDLFQRVGSKNVEFSVEVKREAEAHGISVNHRDQCVARRFYHLLHTNPNRFEDYRSGKVEINCIVRDRCARLHTYFNPAVSLSSEAFKAVKTAVVILCEVMPKAHQVSTLLNVWKGCNRGNVNALVLPRKAETLEKNLGTLRDSLKKCLMSCVMETSGEWEAKKKTKRKLRTHHFYLRLKKNLKRHTAHKIKHRNYMRRYKRKRGKQGSAGGSV
jgi:hypothetical protein